MRVYTMTAAAAAGLMLVGFAACGGGGSSPTSPSGGGTVATVTITANGVTPTTLQITAGQQVRFVNNDATTREMLSTPHLVHDDCPAINAVGSLAPGADRMTDRLNTVRICGFHDHRNPDDMRFRGQINVGMSTGPGPGYIKP